MGTHIVHQLYFGHSILMVVEWDIIFAGNIIRISLL